MARREGVVTKRLWIVAGPNGAGKSTLVHRYNTMALPVSNPDEIARQLDASHPEGKGIEAGRRALNERREFFSAGRSFILETTFSGKGALATIKAAKAHGYKVSLVFVALKAPAVSLLRVRSRVAQGGHDVAEADILRRYDRSFDNAILALSQVDKAYVIENTQRLPSLVARIEKRVVRRFSARVPVWLKERFPILHRGLDQGLSL